MEGNEGLREWNRLKKQFETEVRGEEKYKRNLDVLFFSFLQVGRGLSDSLESSFLLLALSCDFSLFLGEAFISGLSCVTKVASHVITFHASLR